jgi:hypothetical protein
LSKFIRELQVLLNHVVRETNWLPSELIEQLLKTGLWDVVRQIPGHAIGATRIAFGVANHILGSMLAIPGVEKIDEFKKTVESGLEVVQYLAGGGE